MAIFRNRKTAAPDDRIPPLVVRKGREADETAWRKTAAEFAPVIEIMDRRGMIDAGFTLASDSGISTEDPGSRSSAGAQEKLLLARQAIQEEVDRDGTIWGLPDDAFLCYRGLVVRLFGHEEPGLPQAYQYYGPTYRSGRVTLVPVRPSSVIVTAA
jgi:hypothetical protein